MRTWLQQIGLEFVATAPRERLFADS